LLPCLVSAPLPLRSWCAARAGRLRRAVASVSGLLRRRCPVLRRASRGRGGSCWGSLRLQRGSSWARTMRPRGFGCLPLRIAPLLRLGAKARPLAVSVAACGCALLRLGASRPAPVLPAAVLPAAAGSRCAVTQPPLPNCTEKQPNCTEKRQKARFLCGISPQASLYASMDSTLKSPIFGGFRAAIDAAQSPKRYLKPSTWWGAAPFRAGGKAQCPRIQGNCLLQPTFITVAKHTRAAA
jgi:hypothetical protein